MVKNLCRFRQFARVASLILATSCAIYFALIAPEATQQAQAGGLCSLLYIVQPGDKAEDVAARFQLDMDQLIILVRGRMVPVTTLRAGQFLCVPQSDAAKLPTGNIALEATFIYTPTLGESEWNLSKDQGYLGQRLALPLESLEGIVVFTKTAEFLSAISTTVSADNVPVLAGRINPLLQNEYTLIVFGGDDFIQSVRFTDTIPLTHSQGTPIEIAGALATTDVLTTTFTVWLEFPGTARYPYQINQITFVPADGDVFRRDYLETSPRRPAFVVFRSQIEPGRYRIYVLVTPGDAGPGGGGGRYRLCEVLSYRGFWGWFRRWYCR